ncbi:MAG: hypothetical protein DHS20C14_00890 [Phycisphaeraceae bacterium]|nr:MAG: hypothetical protein DHS20C14_00890 [Phycisphaeraceae bacterium]
MALTIAMLALGLVVAHWVVSEKRYKRVKRRLAEALDRSMLAVPEALVALRGPYIEQYGKGTRLPLTFRSQFGEDMALVQLFGGRRDGFFIEAGANDGLRYSTTYALEALGWDGLLVEPIPALADLCRQRRPHATVINAALGRKGSTGTAKFVVYEQGDYDQSEDRKDLASHLAEANPDFRKPSARGASEIEVKLTTVDALLDEHPRQVDVAVIDVEGGELDLIDGFDLERHKPRVVIIEDHNLMLSDDQRRIIEARGYEQAGTLGFNRFMIHKSETDLLERARALLCLDQVEAI